MEAPLDGCAVLRPLGVKASGDDGNLPANTLDGQLNTRWSAHGKGAWIRYEVDPARPLCAVQVAWYRGDSRSNTFTIAVSADGSTWQDLHSARSTGKTRALETYELNAPPGTRYLRITVNGNTTNDWASIAEVAVQVRQQAPVPAPRPSPSPGDATVDPLGVHMVHPTRAGGQAWFLGADPQRDARFDPQDTITRNADGSWKMRSSQVRMNVLTEDGYSTSRIATYDRRALQEKGYMQTPKDWRNLEMTAFFRLNSAPDVDFKWLSVREIDPLP
ncbi:discoidin domain-containing protein [Vitiosangium sp. GDMCC 1.1324]|uniref:discoidin domain-containing protein n=1 Tax=Vitiosangium sp. (strain GDMCC 1.1324) TaxID=2138576 RepID=UPI000D36989C|nr:discoidin domain-containing protein [Vitiosangium sp. GDMCC 1.1324]PTL80099.1 hypothetical protein DAT35_29170 [Vitiosangium sp. GDMCC 1.1324]